VNDERRGDHERGHVTLLWGDGKGKTSAAMGMALRALGAGLRVHLIAFLKSSETLPGELIALTEYPGFDWEIHGGQPFLDGTPGELPLQVARRGLAAASCALQDPEIDLVVLDEILYAVELGVIHVHDVLELLDAKRSASHVILTGGWQVHPDLLATADGVTELRKGKHPFDLGASARRGIEY
jgi:cob(I)alamin adenosyltransferase